MEKQLTKRRKPEVLEDRDTRTQADYGEEEAMLQKIKRSSTERCGRAVMTGRWTGQASRGLKAQALKGKDRYKRLCNEEL